MIKPAFEIQISINAGELRERVFDLLEAEKSGAITLEDPLEEEAHVKDIIACYPTESGMSWSKWWKTYALPLLIQGGMLKVRVTGDGVDAGISQSYQGAEPHPWCRVDKDKLTADAGAKLEQIKSIVNGPLG